MAASTSWSPRIVHVVIASVGFAGIAASWLALAAVTAAVEPLAAMVRNWGSYLGDPLSTALWTPVVVVIWSLSFLRRSTTALGGHYRARTPLPFWLVAPWVPFALGNVAWLGVLVYYAPMAVGFATEMLLEARRDAARAVLVPGAKWTEQDGMVTVSIPSGAEIKGRLEADPKSGLLVRGDGGLEIELHVGLEHAVVLGSRLDLTLPLSEIARWSAEPVSLSLRARAS